jgi:hypothetical protein
MGDPNVREIHVDPDTAESWYVNAYAGIYITRDAGATWEHHLSDYCAALEIDPNDHDILYASSQESVFRSDDRGRTWQPMYTFPSTVTSILVSSIDSSVYAGVAWGSLPTANGIYKSTDQGNSWNFYSYGVAEDGLIPWDIEEDPVNNKLYVCTEIWDHPDPYNPPFFRSSNGGLTWDEISGTLPWHAIRIQVHPLTQDVYVLTEGAGLYKSTNFGDTWVYMNNYFGLELLIDKNYPSRFFGGKHTFSGPGGGVYESTDTGTTFDFAGLSGNIVGSLCLDGSSSTLHAACYSTGIYTATYDSIPRTWYILPDGSGDAPTIQAGIDSAAVGDTVLLANGTFTGTGNRDIDYLGKSITVRSESNDPDSCIVDCEGLARGFYCPEGDADTRLEGITITRGNAAATTLPLVNVGGALFLDGSTDGPVVTNCVFLDNEAGGHGGAVHGGYSGTPRFVDCQFIENTAGSWGGGFICGWGMGKVCSPTFINCMFLRNSCGGSGGGLSGGKSDEGTAVFLGCVFAGNVATQGGGLISEFHELTVTNCTFSDNSASAGGGIFVRNTAPTIENTIVTFSGNGGALQCAGDSIPTLISCDIYDNVGGDWVGCLAGQESSNNNFSANPFFCDPSSDDFSLSEYSPCLPAYSPGSVLVGACEQGCDEAVAIADDVVSSVPSILEQNYPNPFNPKTRIRFTLSEATYVRLSIYDVEGRLVRVLVSDRKPADQYEIEWDGRDQSGQVASSGVYFYRLKTGQRVLTKKMVLLK